MTKFVITLISFLLFGTFAQADGFLCAADQEALHIKIFHHVSPELGVRRGAVVIVSDQNKPRGQKTIAVFRDEAGALKTGPGTEYVAYMGQREDAFMTPDQEMLGISLKEVYSLVFHLEFDYSDRAVDGARIPGEMIIVKRNAERQYVDIECRRYLNKPRKWTPWLLDL